ncbi:Dbl homology domain-containing protein [Pisolithus albus]|nr:Dbl homology domain-containing protein [Pisolithus albus]
MSKSPLAVSLRDSEGRRSDFSEDVVFEAHASKSGGDWWYETTVNDGRSAFSRRQVVDPVQATAVYSYEGSSPDKLSFAEGNALTIVDRLGLLVESRAEWYCLRHASSMMTVRLTSESSDLDATETFSNQERHELERRRVLEVARVIVSEPVDHNRPTSLHTNEYGGVDGVVAPWGPTGKKGSSIGDTLPRKQAPTREPLSCARHKELPPVPTMDFSEDAVVAGRTGTSARLSPISEILSTSLQTDTPGEDVRLEQYIARRRCIRALRNITPDIDRERKIPIISGPIHASASNTETVPGDPHNSMTRESSPTFGTSLASLPDRTALEGIPAVERKRQEAIFELDSTEADYVRDLQLIVELFYSRLVDMLEAESTSVVFSNIEDSLLTNTAFLSTLEERQRECRLYIDHVGDLLETHMPHMRVYLDYCVNQASAGKVLQSLRDANPELSAQLQCLREDPSARNLDLSSYLLVPMQRLTRYLLLIRQILQYTDPPTSTPDLSVVPRLTLSLPTEHAERESIANSLACAEQKLEEVNETIRDREGRERLGEVSEELRIGKDRLDLTLPTHHLGPRRLLKEGVLAKAKSGRKLRVLLRSDILPLLNESEGGGLYRPLPVHELEIHPSRRYVRSEDAYIRIHRGYPRGGETLVLRAPGIREARAWTEAIVLAAAKAKEGIRVAVGDSQDTKVGFGPTTIGVGMGHVASAGSPRGSGDVGNGCSG